MFCLRIFSVNFLMCLFICTIESAELNELFKWRELKYDWPSTEMMERALESGVFKPKNNLPLGMDVWRNKIFLTVPRWRSGVASSLNYIDLSSDQPEILHPYPGWNENFLDVDDLNAAGIKSPATIVSTFRIAVDECDRLWVMDTGKEDILNTNKNITIPALVIFDLKTDSFIRRYDFSFENSPFGIVVIDIENGDCGNAFAYISDFIGGNLFVYSYAENKSWQIKKELFKYEEKYHIHRLGEFEYPWKAGVFGLALGNRRVDGSRTVYINSISSLSAYTVSNRVLQDESYSLSSDSDSEFKILGYRNDYEQATAQIYDPNTEVLIYMLVDKDSIECWNTNRPYAETNRGLVWHNVEKLTFPNEVKMDNERNIWVLTNKMPLYIYKKLDYEDFNYRILKGKIDDVLDGTICL